MKFSNLALTRFYTFALALSCSFCFSDSCFADMALANQNLKQAIDEIEVAKNDVLQAEQQEPKGERIQFHYDWVIADLNKVEGGIQSKFSQANVEPRVIEPVNGDYLSLIGESPSSSVGVTS